MKKNMPVTIKMIARKISGIQTLLGVLSIVIQGGISATYLYISELWCFAKRKAQPMNKKADDMVSVIKGYL